MNKKILVVAAHPDDEVLGVGGALLRHTAEGDIVHIMILAEGITSRGAKRDVARDEEKLSNLQEASKKVADFIGVERLICAVFPIIVWMAKSF